MTARLFKHSIKVNGSRTSISLEAPFWDEVRRIAKEAGIPVGDFVGTVKAQVTGRGLSSALRVAVLDDLKAKIGEVAHG